jgi:hypothetical protein
MKSIYTLLVYLMISIPALVQACPTCIGKLERDTPPFFSPEYDTYCTTCPQKHKEQHSDSKKHASQPSSKARKE